MPVIQPAVVASAHLLLMSKIGAQNHQNVVKYGKLWNAGPTGFCRKLGRCSEKGYDLLLLCGQIGELGKRAEPGRQLAFADHVRDFDPLECR
jgi:hypothetical protein